MKTPTLSIKHGFNFVSKILESIDQYNDQQTKIMAEAEKLNKSRLKLRDRIKKLVNEA